MIFTGTPPMASKIRVEVQSRPFWPHVSLHHLTEREVTKLPPSQIPMFLTGR